MQKLVYIVAVLFFVTDSLAQQFNLSETAEISIITVGPGANLVDSFGHSAIRVKDEERGVDIAYNYGTYDFSAPNFYGNFAKGKLLYILGRNRFDNFLAYYQSQNRTVKEQQLNLTAQETQTYFNYLENNARPENRGYLYDFFYDNCATKLRDVSQVVLEGKINFDYNFAAQKEKSLRDLIHEYSYTQPWGTFGIDLALGSVIDRKAKPEEYVFLPDYIFESFNRATIDSEQVSRELIKNTNILFEAKESQPKFVLTPFVCLLFIALLIIFRTGLDFKNNKRSTWLDFLIFLITGAIGLIMVLLWFATNHNATANNFNILWAFAPNLVVAFYLLKKPIKSWLKYYASFLMLLLFIQLVIAGLHIQAFNIAVYPLIGALAIRYIFLTRAVKV